jgi:hypothetical protein
MQITLQKTPPTFEIKNLPHIKKRMIKFKKRALTISFGAFFVTLVLQRLIKMKIPSDYKTHRKSSSLFLKQDAVLENVQQSEDTVE